MSSPAARPGMLSLSIKDKASLYAAYMPYIKNGGLFIPTTKKYDLGDEVFMLLTLMEDSERIPVAGHLHQPVKQIHIARRLNHNSLLDRQPDIVARLLFHPSQNSILVRPLIHH